MTPPPPKKIHEFLILPQYDSDGDEIPDVDDINIDNKDNRANCISSDIDKVMKSQFYICNLFGVFGHPTYKL